MAETVSKKSIRHSAALVMRTRAGRGSRDANQRMRSRLARAAVNAESRTALEEPKRFRFPICAFAYACCSGGVARAGEPKAASSSLTSPPPSFTQLTPAHPVQPGSGVSRRYANDNPLFSSSDEDNDDRNGLPLVG